MSDARCSVSVDGIVGVMVTTRAERGSRSSHCR